MASEATEFWRAAVSFFKGLWRRALYFLPAGLILPFDIYEKIVRPAFGSPSWPERLIMPGSAFPWIFALTAVWVSLLTYRDLYKEKLELEDVLPQTDNKLIDQIIQFYRGRTAAEGDRLAAPYIGAPVKLKYKVKNVTVEGDRKFALVFPDGRLLGYLHFLFRNERVREAERIQAGATIMVKVNIQKTDLGIVVIADCELITP